MNIVKVLFIVTIFLTFWIQWAYGASDLEGPKKNNMHCDNTYLSNQEDGEITCYGIWDYGNEFGNDSYMCPKYWYSNWEIGCQIDVKSCKSGIATATAFYQPTRLSLDSDELEEFSEYLDSTPEVIKEQIPGLWEYRCGEILEEEEIEEDNEVEITAYNRKNYDVRDGQYVTLWEFKVEGEQKDAGLWVYLRSDTYEYGTTFHGFDGYIYLKKDGKTIKSIYAREQTTPVMKWIYLSDGYYTLEWSMYVTGNDDLQIYMQYASGKDSLKLNSFESNENDVEEETGELYYYYYEKLEDMYEDLQDASDLEDVEEVEEDYNELFNKYLKSDYRSSEITEAFEEVEELWEEMYERLSAQWAQNAQLIEELLESQYRATYGLDATTRNKIDGLLESFMRKLTSKWYSHSQITSKLSAVEQRLFDLSKQRKYYAIAMYLRDGINIEIEKYSDDLDILESLLK